MIPYIFIYIYVLLLSFFNHSIYGRFFKFIIYLNLIIFISVRSISVGTDTKNYFDIFNNTGFLDIFKFELEPFFVILVYISKFVYNDFSFYLFLVSFIFIFIWSKIFNKIKEDYTIVLVSFLSFFVFLGFFNINRQYLAVSICLYSLFHLFEGNNKFFIVLVLVASLFHFPAIFFLLVLFIIFFKNHFFIFISSLLVSILSIDLFLSFLGDSNIKNSYSNYVEKLDTVSGIFIILFFVFQYLFFSFIKSFVIPFDKRYEFFLKIFAFGVGFFLACKILKVLDEGPTRLAFYFLTVNIFLFPIAINSIRDIRIKMLFKFIFILFSFIYYFNFLYSGSGELFPYVLDDKFRVF